MREKRDSIEQIVAPLMQVEMAMSAAELIRRRCICEIALP